MSRSCKRGWNHVGRSQSHLNTNRFTRPHCKLVHSEILVSAFGLGSWTCRFACVCGVALVAFRSSLVIAPIGQKFAAHPDVPHCSSGQCSFCAHCSRAASGNHSDHRQIGASGAIHLGTCGPLKTVFHKTGQSLRGCPRIFHRYECRRSDTLPAGWLAGLVRRLVHPNFRFLLAGLFK